VVISCCLEVVSIEILQRVYKPGGVQYPL